MNKLFFAALLSGALVACGGPTPEATVTTAPATAPAAAPAPPATADDAPGNYQRYAQYLWCRIDGQPYLAYHAEGHTTNISNPVNMARRTDFVTSADQVPLNGDTKISDMQLLLFNLTRKGAGQYRSPRDFHLDGRTAFAQGAGLREVHFAVADGQTLTVSSLKEGVAEGTFSLDVVDQNNKGRVLKLTDGHFRLALDGGLKSLTIDENGDTDLQKMMKDAMK